MNKYFSPLRYGACALMAAGGLVLALPAKATSLVYEATAVTDIKVNGHRYHNATVTVSFTGNPADVAQVVDGSGTAVASGASYCNGPGYFWWIKKGDSSVSVTSHGHTIVAHFAPGQLFVALDTCNGGIGFGSFVGPNGLEPAYPLAYTLGTAMAFAESTPNPLGTPAHMSGSPWSCIGYPPTFIGSNGQGNGLCVAPDAYPLHSDIGDVVFYLPYTNIITTDGSLVGNHVGNLNQGTFSIQVVKDE